MLAITVLALFLGPRCRWNGEKLRSFAHGGVRVGVGYIFFHIVKNNSHNSIVVGRSKRGVFFPTT